ncbi:MAG: hypothetical protein ACRYG8_03420 [Janthinobacterium lividum]
MATRKPGTSLSSSSAPSDAVVAKVLPRAVRLTRPHGYIDEEGRHRTWRAGHVAEHADEVALLVGRGAQHEVLE